MTEASTQSPPRYNVLGELRDGPGERAYRARDGETGAEVALHTWDRERAPRALLLGLQAGIGAYAAIDHPRLLRPRALRVDAENVVLEAQHVPGETLDRALARDAHFPPARALAIAEDILDGLVTLHAAGLAHGAVRPSTVWIARDGRAHLMACGVGPLLVHLGDESYCSVFERYVPVAPERRPARDVYAAAAILFQMIEGRAPHAGTAGEVAAKIRRERFPDVIGQSVARVFAAVSPWSDDGSRPDAATLLAMVRHARETAPPSEDNPADTPTLLDTPEPESLRLGFRERVNAAALAALRQVYAIATGSAWPTLAAAALAALLAALLAGPFLGSENWWPEASKTAQAMPAGSELAAAAARPPAPLPPAPPAPPAARPAQTPWERAKEEVIALAEIGDYEAALLRLSGAEGPEGERMEEFNAVIARAQQRMREMRETTNRLAAAGRLAEAKQQWDDVNRYWPTPDLRKQAAVEFSALDPIAAEAEARRKEAARERTARDVESELRRHLVACFARDEGTHDERVRATQAVFQHAVDTGATAAREETDAILEVLQAEAAFLAAARDALKRRVRRARIEQISKRFGSGDIPELKSESIVVARGEGRIEEIPLGRLTGRERYSLFSPFLSDSGGADALALAAISLRMGLQEEARQHLFDVENRRGLDRSVRVLRRAMEEAQR